MADREQVADTAYRSYMRGMADHGVFLSRPFSKDRKTWLRVADFIIQQDLDTIKFIEAQIESMPSRTELEKLLPSELCRLKGAALARYQKVEPTDNLDMHRHSYATMMGHLSSLRRRLIPRVFAGVDQLLINPGFPFSAWFRVLLAPADSEGFPHIMKCYLEQAKEEVVADPALRRFLDEVKSEYDLSRFGWVVPTTVGDRK